MNPPLNSQRHSVLGLGAPVDRSPVQTYLGYAIFLVILLIFGAATSFHLEIASRGWEGVKQSGAISLVHQQLIWPYLPDSLKIDFFKADNFLWFLAICDLAVFLSLFIARRFKPIALCGAAAYTLAASLALVLANDKVAGVPCACTGVRYLDFDESWKTLLRNAGIIAGALWAAFIWNRPAENKNPSPSKDSPDVRADVLVETKDPE